MDYPSFLIGVPFFFCIFMIFTSEFTIIDMFKKVSILFFITPNNFWDEVTEQGQVEALHIAVIKNNLEIVKKLISKNPAIANIKSEQSNSTALTYAVIEGRDERIIQILVNNGGTISKMARGYRNDVPVERDVADAAEAAEEDARYNSGGYKSRKRRSQKNKRRTQKNKRRRSIKGRRRVKR